MRLSTFQRLKILVAGSILVLGSPLVAAPVQDSFSQQLEEVSRFFDDGLFDEAGAKALELFHEAQKRFGKDSLEVARTLDHLVRIRYRNAGRRDVVTLGYARRSLDIWEKLAPGSGGHGDSLHWLGAIAESLDELDEAERLYLRSLEVRKALYGERHPSVAQSYDYLGSLLLGRAGDDAEARTLAEQMVLQGLSLREELFGPESLEVAESCNSLVRLYYNLGHYELGRSYAQRSLELREALLAPSHPLVGRSWHNLAVMDHKLGRISEAQKAIRRALEIRTAAFGEDHPEVGSTHSSLASLLRDTGDFAGAEKHYRAALKPMGKGYGEDHSRYATVLSNLALLLEYRGDYEKAQELQRRSLEIRRGTDREGKTLAWLGRLEWRMGDSEKGRSLLRKGLKLQKRRQGQGHPDLVDSLVSLAEIELDEGRIARAESLYQRAAAILEGTGRAHPGLAEIYLHLSRARQLRGSEGEALELALRAQQIIEAHFGPRHPQQAEILMRLAELRRAGGSQSAALLLALEAHQLSRSHLRATGRFLPERAALAYLSSLENGLDLGLSILAETSSPAETARAWDVLIRGRASVLDELAQRSRTLHLAASETASELLQQQTEAYRRLTNLISGGGFGISQESHSQQIRQAHRKAEAADEELARFVSSLVPPTSPGSASLVSVRRALDEDAALIAFVVFERRHRLAPGARGAPEAGAGRPTYGAFVTGPGGGSPAFLALEETTQVDDAVRELRESARRALDGMEGEEHTYRRIGEGLRKALWDPVADLVSGAKRIFVVPDGNLALMSFAALPAAGGGYLLESGSTFHVLTTERDLLRPVQRARGKGILLVGGVNFDARRLASTDFGREGPGAEGNQTTPKVVVRGSRSACLDEGRPYFEPLPQTFPEVSEILRKWTASQPRKQGDDDGEPVTLLSGTRAEEGEFKRLAPGRSILHVSTHGFFYGGECSKDLVGAEGEVTRSPIGNPLAISGLAFAGANSRQVTASDTEDGVLTAEEVATLNLQGVSWVVLSACETAQGRTSAGEGVLGLRRAFRIAGAETVVMSLWPVEDALAREWMAALYSSRLEDGASTAEAVRSASLTVLEKLRRKGRETHPVFWANFVASGGWD